MRRKVLSILALTILVTSTLVGCSGASPADSTLTILSITDGTVLVMKAGTDSWTQAETGMSLQVGDTIKTGDDSGAEITFFDGSTIELEAGTQIQITSLDSSPDTGTKTITLMQTIGTTISRVTKLLDPASTYAIETPTGVAAVRGSVMIVRIIFNDPNYEDGTVLITNLEGHIWAIWQGVELQIPEGQQGIIVGGLPPELIPLNRPPVATSDSVVTDADSSITVDAPGVLSNDSDPDGDSLTVTAVDTSGTVGAVTWSANGSFTYDPNGQFEYLQAGNSTSDSFTYTVSDGHGGTDTATVTVIINGVYETPIYFPPTYYPPVNYPPVAIDDTAITTQNTSVTINVLNNDSDPNGHTLTVTSVTPGTHGSVTINGSNVTYTPNSGFTGIDSFTYTISDGHGGTDTATVTIVVASINHPPVAVDDSAAAPQDTPVTIDVLDNDYDIDGDTLTVALLTQGTHGSVTINGNNVTYTPDTGYTGADSFTYMISDGKGGTATATVTITVTVIETTATIRITVDEGPTAPVYVRDTTTGQMVVDGNEEASVTIGVAGGHSYCVWVGGNATRYVNSCPNGWSGEGGQEACGTAEAGGNYPVHFTQH
jgi:VCBS repeat-containing protein